MTKPADRRPGSQRRLRKPVISVGNLAMGGRGKTPLVASLAGLLLGTGERPSILTRGYGRRHVEPGVVVVSDGVRPRADLDRSGDEPLMLALALPGVRVLVAEQRVLAGALAEHALGATVHLLDDGFQHRSLARDVDLVLVTPADLRDRRVPFGRLREPLSALAAATAIVVDEAEADDLPAVREQILRVVGGGDRPIFTLGRGLGPPIPLERGWPAPARRPVLAFAGLARPERFAHLLEANGRPVSRLVAFGNHHRYSRRDLARIADAWRQSGAEAMFTTEKDAVRLRPLRPTHLPIFAVPLVASVEPADTFRAWLLARLDEARACG